MTASVDKSPGTPLTKVERTPASTPGGAGGRVREEKIFVTVRVRPLSSRELAHRDSSAWDCINENTILFKHSSQDRSNCPSSYTFDRVFGPSCSTERVYQEGAKDVTLSALTGINATIFAYGQTSSGKTFTMRGIIENAINDLYRYIENNPDRDFVLKISALEIYNEIVRDLLNPESGALRLLDDPEKGTIVERLVEKTVKDSRHLRQIIAVCEAQRQVGETALNDNSSRSHQIIRLTVESTLRATSGTVKALMASLNFVDLAGSERASQTNAEGARLKEGCHINRSLLTLSTVIRKLSGGKRNGHIPYRDSKLTRILQLSLGGNSRTAIICTMSPALSHVEQSRNTLSFATRAKEVTNSAQVNMVISEKELVKHLQKEVARLEAELHTPESTTAVCSESLLMEKELQIKKMETEMQELKLQLDCAQARLDEYRRMQDDQQQIKTPEITQSESPRALTQVSPMSPNHGGERDEENRALVVIGRSRNNPIRQTMRQSTMRQSTTALVLVQEIRKLEQLQDELGQDASRALEALQKEVVCLRLAQAGMNNDAAQTIAKLQAEIKDMNAVRSTSAAKDVGPIVNVDRKSMNTNLMEEISRLQAMGDTTIASLEEQLENVQKSIDNLVLPSPDPSRPSNEASPSPAKSKSQSRKKKTLPLSLNNSCNRQHLLRSPCSPRSRRYLGFENENNPPRNANVTTTTPTKSEDGEGVSSREGTPSHRRSSSVNVRKMQNMFKTAAEENIKSIRTYVTELKERVAKLQYQKQLLVCQVLELEANENTHIEEGADGEDGAVEGSAVEMDLTPQSPRTRRSFFEQQQEHIIELWDLCQVSIIHRTQFYLLFKGDPADEIYMEVELRRLTWLEQHFAELGNASPASGPDDHVVSLASSARALKRERELLARRMRSRFSSEEREMLFTKWEIPLEGKQRKLQLVQKLWTNPHCKRHIQESAEIVAKLVGFCEPGHVSKEMFELNFAPPSDQKAWLFGWNPIAKLLDL
jgi:centromeric protein E